MPHRDALVFRRPVTSNRTPRPNNQTVAFPFQPAIQSAPFSDGLP
ncbi:hypothetical protein HMPREF9120_00454 [Neisseria sp. oral taxon 020 str. F0370]|nr:MULTISPECIES: hypothetical protein [unclassified Neisseria]EKY09402.1 hypothetical protein HMPREF9120_00454 [Neisseria sp. oral taxon 020 str. F0370]